MRVLFVAFPAHGHQLPLVPLAWAARVAGHEVLFAGDRTTADLIVPAGLPTIEISDIDVFATCDRILGFTRATDTQIYLETIREWHYNGALPDVIAKIFALAGDLTAEGLIRVAREWSADVIVYEPFMPVAQLAASVLGIPAVMHGIGIPFPSMTTMFAKTSKAWKQCGGGIPPTAPAATIDVWPASMRPSYLDSGWPMRYCPYNKGAVLPKWLHEPLVRPRVCITMGTAVPVTGGTQALDLAIDAVSKCDVDAVVLDSSARAGDSLPDNCRSVGWIPLNAILPTCSALIHHGGAGTTSAALAAGVPQLVIPHFADQPANAEVVADRGVGLCLRPDEVESDSIRNCLGRILDDAAISIVAAAVRAEINSMPSPSELVERLAALAAARSTESR
ncbi:nucleotide disphospho-sugar-binding domain-containing protein [Saccharopolyspora phatthalungensis]|uniref:UDP:flavonoid glycosyltransferase YjiC (YdhE family) n=1 Tax=Saccharopolyspora phatthalungensis TaxID=664693 RepID=A0A840QHM1_9PSEU|nr:nucleotide disphospho-sugar-binding domain-containing protein [Saccharopolyspora phatthalungensis]MBB5159510.1 UDP:flavonoid glycosyltransferase YjiC (YdhE family) [Saccharopolyspora phatthalungensis]